MLHISPHWRREEVVEKGLMGSALIWGHCEFHVSFRASPGSPAQTRAPFSQDSSKGGAVEKQGVVVYIILHIALLNNTTPIHCTSLPLHPPVMSTQLEPGPPFRHPLKARSVPPAAGSEFQGSDFPPTGLCGNKTNCRYCKHLL